MSVRRRRRANINDLLALTGILGGDSNVAFFYDFRRNLVQNAGSFVSWLDYRGGGFGPILNVINGTAPTIGADIINAGAGSIASAASAIFDLTSVINVYAVGKVSIALGQYFFSIADAAARSRQMGIKNNGGVAGDISGVWFTGGAEQVKPAGPDSGSNRYALSTKGVGLVGSLRVMRNSVGTVAISARAAGANTLTLFDLFPGVGSLASNGGISALIGIKSDPTNTQDQAVSDWAHSTYNTLVV